jgi:hypothetical protein
MAEKVVSVLPAMEIVHPAAKEVAALIRQRSENVLPAGH